MKHGNDGGIAPSYNVRITTDAKKNVIVELGVNQCSSDADVSLREVVKQVEDRLDRKPRQVVADGGNTDAVYQAAGRGCSQCEFHPRC